MTISDSTSYIFYHRGKGGSFLSEPLLVPLDSLCGKKRFIQNKKPRNCGVNNFSNIIGPVKKNIEP